MSTSRNGLRNRKNHQLATQSFLTKEVDYSQLEEFLNFFSNELLIDMPEKEKQKKLMKLREELSKCEDIKEFSKKPEKLQKLLDKCFQQTSESQYNEDATSFTGFLKTLGTSLVSSKLNVLFPGLVLASQFAASAASHTPDHFHFHAHKPVDGDDLCAALNNCIQGFLSEMRVDGKSQNAPHGNLPQIASIVEKEAADTKYCISHLELREMLIRDYKGPNSDITDCTVSSLTPDNGNITVKATNVDPITCDLMKDSLIGFTDRCIKPTKPGVDAFPIVMGVGLGVGALALLSFVLYKYVKHNREQALLHNPQIQYNTL